MNNPYPTEKQAQEKELAFILWQIQEARNELRELQATKDSIRRRAKRQIVKWIIGISLTAISLFFVGRELYLYFFWY